MQDTACNYVGGFAMAASLPWGVAGKVKASGGLTWLQVEGAGHMTPINNPAAAAYALGTLLPRDAGAQRRLSAAQCAEAAAGGPRPGAAAVGLGDLGRLYLQRARAVAPRGLAGLALAACACGLAAGLP